jgi:hypothetical protein
VRSALLGLLPGRHLGPPGRRQGLGRLRAAVLAQLRHQGSRCIAVGVFPQFERISHAFLCDCEVTLYKHYLQLCYWGGGSPFGTPGSATGFGALPSGRFGAAATPGQQVS